MKNKTTHDLLKLASVISVPKDTLAPTVFDSTNKLLPRVRKYILETILKVVPSEDIRGMYIRGSITGYKYNENSDVDVDVAIENWDESISKVRLTRQINGNTAPNSTHPIDFYLNPWDEMYEINLSKSSVGVYDVLANGWLTPPGDRNEVRHPKEEF